MNTFSISVWLFGSLSQETIIAAILLILYGISRKERLQNKLEQKEDYIPTQS